MNPLCAECKKAPTQDEPITVIRNNRLYFFCGKQCKDQWIESSDSDQCLRFF